VLKKAMSKKTKLWINCVGNRGRADISCSYMAPSSSQIWFLSPPKFFFHLFMLPYSLLVGSLLRVLSLFLLFLSGHSFDSLCFSLLRRCVGNGWAQLLYYIAGLCLSYYLIDERCHNKRSRLLSIITASSKFRSHIATLAVSLVTSDTS